MNRFEQLIEYVINDEEQKARELFHDIVVEKSRKIYEDIMAADEEVEEEIDEGFDDAGASGQLIIPAQAPPAFHADRSCRLPGPPAHSQDAAPT